MGAGISDTSAPGTDCNTIPKPATCYTENRATLHLHGGNTPWISDGTPHQWTVPVGDNVAASSKRRLYARMCLICRLPARGR